MAGASTAIMVEDFRPDFDLDELVQKTGMARDDPELLKMVEAARENCFPAGGALVCAIEPGGGEDMLIGGTVFNSALLREKLSGLGRVFPYIATEGPKMAAWGEKFQGPLVHALRQMAVKSCERELEKRLCEKFGIPMLSAMNPGSLKEWPISEQGRLLGLLCPLPELVGASLLPSGIMRPDYTVSGIFFQTDKKYYNCQLCPRENCPNRKAPRE